jgi:hypothetical protein
MRSKEMNSVLEDAKEAFAEWRSNRKRQGRVNHALKRMALELLEQYPLLTVSNAIGVKPNTLTGWKRLQEDNEKAVTFIPLSPYEEPEIKNPNSSDVSMPCSLKLMLPGNLELTLPEQGMEKMIPFLRALSKEFCS